MTVLIDAEMDDAIAFALELAEQRAWALAADLWSHCPMLVDEWTFVGTPAWSEERFACEKMRVYQWEPLLIGFQPGCLIARRGQRVR